MSDAGTAPATHALVNFRDASGPATAAYATPGGELRRGVLFRSDNATALDDATRAMLTATGLRRAFDLRSASERRRVPSVFGELADVRVVVFDDLTSFNEGALAGQLLTTLVGRGDVAGLMELYYRQLPAVFAAPIGTIVRELADGTDPVVVHCRGGKDRTGFVVAVLGRAVGVDPRDVTADYLASAGLFRPGPEEDAMLAGIERRTGVRLDAATLAPMMTVAPAYLDAAFAVIDAEGGFDRYLRERCGVDDALRDRLTARLVG